MNSMMYNNNQNRTENKALEQCRKLVKYENYILFKLQNHRGG